MLRSSLLVAVLLCAMAALVPALNHRPASARMLRALEEQGYAWDASDVTRYHMQFGKCVRVKIPQDDEDEEEGNSYFYNGRYYSQGMYFASVFMCEQSSSNGDMCGVCDTSREYVVELADYLDSQLEYVDEMCTACGNQCGNRRRRRRLDQQDQEPADDQMTVDCSTCQTQCATIQKNLNAHNGKDETSYLECQEAFQDENGLQLYSGPSCENGNIVIGFFYDDECTVHSSSTSNDLGLDFSTFGVVQDLCISCGNDQNDNDQQDDNNVCVALTQDATICSGGRTISGGDNDNEEMPICKTYATANRTREFSKGRRSWHMLELVIATILIVAVCSGFLTLSYTYYLRHRQVEGNKEPLVNQHDITKPSIEQTDMTTATLT